MKAKQKIKARKRDGHRPQKRWVLIHLGMLVPEELKLGMEIATAFEESHGGKPPMYFARYTEDNSIRITVLTNQDSRTLKKHFKKFGVHTFKVTEKGGGSWEHCHMYQVAKHVFAKQPKELMDVIHWLHNMCNYSYLQEVTNYSDMAASFLCRGVERPNQKPQPTPAA